MAAMNVKCFVLGLFFFVVSSSNYSCSINTSNIQIVRHTSDLLTCHLIFGKSVKMLQERNEILLQIGLIDTTDEQLPIPVAIIHVTDKEVILNLLKSSVLGDTIRQSYSGEGYNLILQYGQSKNSYNSLVCKGSMVIQKQMYKEELEIEGWDCNL